MSVKLSRQAYAKKYGPTAGDRIRLADTELVIEVQEHYGNYGGVHFRRRQVDS